MGRLLVAAWVMVALVAVLIVVVLVQGARIDDLEKSVQQVQLSAGSSAGSYAEMKLDDVCRLIGAVAQKDGIPIAAVFAGETMTTCEASAGQGAAAVRSAG